MEKVSYKESKDMRRLLIISKKKKVIIFAVIFMIFAAVCIITVCSDGKKKNRHEDTIRIALIDTGISTKAIDEKYIGEGYNYLFDNDYTEDSVGHGTAIASIIVGSEKADIEGKCDNVLFVPLVYCSNDEEDNLVKVEVSVLAQMIRDAVDVYDCKIINISSGIKKEDDSLKCAIEYAADKGALIVSCAGNEGTEDIYYPGGYDDVLCVGSLNEELTGAAEFSQKNDTVDVLAPGENIPVATMKGNPITESGTSYSAACVTGYAADLWSKDSELTANQVKKKVIKKYGK